jgi:hypothetical protein
VWYDSDGREVVGLEPGAIGVRASPSFLRFGQFELFHQREETPLLHELAHHALRRDFAHLRLQVRRLQPERNPPRIPPCTPPPTLSPIRKSEGRDLPTPTLSPCPPPPPTAR